MTEGETRPKPIGRAQYARAEQYLPGQVKKLISNSDVSPVWFEDSDRFWYRVRTPDGHEFILVDPAAGTREPAFDHTRLAAALSRATGVPRVAEDLPFETFTFDADGRAVLVTVDDTRWRYDPETNTCERVDAEQRSKEELRSPDGRWAAFVQDHNLWLWEVATGEAFPATSDGTPSQSYATPLPHPHIAAGMETADGRPRVIWSPDCTKLLTHRSDERGVGQLHLLQSTPLDGSVRPKVHAYSYPLAGEEHVPTFDFFIISAGERTITPARIAPLPYLNWGDGPIFEKPSNGPKGLPAPSWSWWSPDSRLIYQIRIKRWQPGYDLFEIDAATGESRLVLEETARTRIYPALSAPDGPPADDHNLRVLSGSQELLWFSQRDGWGHLYLYDLQSGTLKRQVTTGAWNVDAVLYVNEAERWVLFTGLGREPGDPYYRRAYTVSLDAGEPRLLTPEDAHHALAVAPSGRFFIDSWSTVAEPPVTVLRSIDGSIVCQLEEVNIDRLLASGWRAPLRFSVKARDGVTDIYGVLALPSSYHPEEKLPVLDYSYGGSQASVAPVGFGKHSTWLIQAIAELGFAVVIIDGLGRPYRSKAFHDHSYRNVADGGLPDHIVALRQLAEHVPQLDLERVGIFGISAGGASTVRALLAHPEFFKVGVASAGNNHHGWGEAFWNEHWGGLPGEHYDENENTHLAGKLVGKLLLIHGEMDDNVHIFQTYRLIDALIEANKDFDLLVLPNRPHNIYVDPYVIRKHWDYFVRHLLGTEPPTEYRISAVNA